MRIRKKYLVDNGLGVVGLEVDGSEREIVVDFVVQQVFFLQDGKRDLEQHIT